MFLSTLTDEYEEYMIAADLTLYSNPLNAALLDGASRAAKQKQAASSIPTDTKGNSDTPNSESGEELEKVRKLELKVFSGLMSKATTQGQTGLIMCSTTERYGPLC